MATQSQLSFNLPISNTTHVFRSMLNEIGLTNNIFRSYDDVVGNRIPAIINNTSFIHKTGVRVSFSKTRIVREYPDRPPSEFRKNKDNYLLKIITTVNCKNSEKEFVLCTIPCMLGSKFCYLYNKNSQEIFEAGECPYDPFGYFLMKGEKCVIIQEQLRNSLALTFVQHGEVITNITCPCKKGTMVMKLQQDPVKRVFEMRIPYYNSKPVELFLLFYAFGSEPERVVERILEFIPIVDHVEVIKILIPSYITFQNHITKYQTEGVKNILKKLLDDAASTTVITGSYDIKAYQEQLRESIFPQISDDELKLTHLALMASQHIRFEIGKRSEDNRDSWSNKRLITAGRQIEKLFLMVWEKQLSEWVNLTTISDGAFQKSDIISNTFTSSMNPNRWGLAKSKTKENIVEPLRRDTETAIYNQISRVNTPTSRNLRLSSVRMVDGNQYGIICPYETPEGEAIGLVKNLACAVNISIFRDPTQFNRILDDMGLPDRRNESCTYPILINGIISAYCEDPREIVKLLKEKRRKLEVPYDVCIFWCEKDLQIQIYCDAERGSHGMFVVNNQTGDLVIFEKSHREKSIWTRSIEELMELGCVEFVDAKEQEYYYLCPSVTKFYSLTIEERREFDYCVIDPQDQFSVMSTTACKANMQQCPRISYQAGMSKQTLGPYSINRDLRFDGSAVKVLRTPTRPLFEQESAACMGLNNMPSGQSMIAAFIARPFNQEDGIELNIDTMREKLQYYKYISFEVRISSIQTKGDYEILKIPNHGRFKDHLYHAIDINSFLPRIGSYINEKDCILPKVRCNPTEKDSSIYAGVGESGYIDRIDIKKGAGYMDVRIKLCKRRYYTLGAKLAARYAQKGVVTKHADIHKPKDIPIIVGGPNHGLIPDMNINPHSIPSRMTMGELLEVIASKYAVQTGEIINGSSFKSLFAVSENDLATPVQELLRRDLRKINEKLSERGMDPDGLEKMGYIKEDGTIEVIENSINVGIIYYQCLRHHAEDKVQYRGENGKINSLTHQPTSGRAKEGGLRMGEMERDAMICHGSESLCLENLCYISDKYQIILCQNCGVMPTNKSDHSYKCKRCGKEDFCRTIVPYPFKLLIQILAAIGIHLRLKLRLSQ
jgi:DNA-directed RNA polymerase beta subunit